MATATANTSALFCRNPHGDFSFKYKVCSFPASNSPSHPNRIRRRIMCQSSSEGKPKAKMSLFDNASNLLTSVLSGGNLGSMPTAEGAVSDLFGKPLFFSLYDWFLEHGAVYKLAFGPKAFVVVSDPIVAKHILKDNAFSYDKGVLADILEPIMGKGLIPADLDTWKQRRRVIAPGFHTLYLEAMNKMFADCSERTMLKFEKLLEEIPNDSKTLQLDLESEFSSLALDIIGLGVFNYDFGSITKESPVIKAVYGTLFEAEHRSTFYIPYWKFPLSRWLVPRQRKFHNDLKIINDCLDGLIKNAKETREEADVEKLQARDYSNIKDASLLRFFVDMRGADVNDRQLRDDLMTMLIAGHETTAAVLTWAVFLLAQNPSKMRKAQAEIDVVLGDGKITLESLKKLQYIRLIIAESLRMYPQPPLLIRRSLASDLLPGGYKGNQEGFAIPPGTDVFISIYNLHRSPYFWDSPNEFEPERFLCVGDQFALMESTVALAMLLQRFDVELKGSPESVELVTGATIHTKNGLWCNLRKRTKTHH
ncbi:hypothetical protein V2J09_009783 [Rumex salicifolius]